MKESLRPIRRVGVIGLGYVGLPLSLGLVKKGFSTYGFDIDSKKIELLQRGESYLSHIPSSQIQEALKKGFSPTDSFSHLREMDAILICVPTPLTPHKTPDLQYVISTVETIRKYRQKGQLVVLESTTYPGTTEEVVRPLLEEGGWKDGHDFFLAYSPEREDPGNPRYQTTDIPKVVGADHPRSLERACELYSQLVPKVIPLSSSKEAEAVKILENTYRAVNIALVNELKILFDRMGINIWKVIEAAGTKPFGFQKFYPGPGLGGHCIPIDPFYLSWKAKEYDLDTAFIELAGKVNTSMPYFVLSKLQDALSRQGKPLKGAKILILGVAYKKDVGDLRESPAIKIISLLLERQAEVSYHDPWIPHFSHLRHYPSLSMSSKELTAELLAEQDAVLIVTDHSGIDYSFVVQHAPLVVDTRNATKDVKKGREKIVLA